MFSPLRRAGLFALASLAALAAGSQAQYLERETDLPEETVAAASCPAEDCLVVEQTATYCSIDPFEMREGLIFSSKSEIALPAGVHVLSQRAALAGFSPRLTTAGGTRDLVASEREIYRIHQEEPDPETRIAPLEWVEVKSAFGAADIAIETLFLKTARWPHEQFFVGDPQDIRWFFEAGRNLFLRLAGTTPLFPGLSGETILYAPCALRDLPDRIFSFRFEDGGWLELRVRVISGTNLIGYFVGRLLEARGEVASVPLQVTDRRDLAFFGSTRSWAEMAIPTLAVRTADDGRACGILLDSSQWESVHAVEGYSAYEMTCDQRRGARLPLKAVSYPPAFGLP